MSPARTRVLLAIVGTFALADCTPPAARALESARRSDVRPSLRFDNQGRERVDVYLLGEMRSWRIGRLEPGQARWLQLPGDIPASDLARLALAVVVDAPLSVDPRRDPRALTTLRQPIGALMGTGWGYAFGQLTTVGQRPVVR